MRQHAVTEVSPLIRLAEAMAYLHTNAERESFLAAILSPAERDDIERRWSVFQRLVAGTDSQREIKRKAEVSIYRVSRVKEAIRCHGDIIKTVILRSQGQK